MYQLSPQVQRWLSDVLDVDFKASKHIHSNQDEVFKIETPSANYYLKISATLKAERDNLQKLEPLLHVPRVIDFYESDDGDYLLISELPGKNLVELIGEWSAVKITEVFATAVRQLHSIDATRVFPEAGPNDVLLHGDIALPNVIISEQEEIGYIDFGQLTFGSPELDLADGIWSLQRNLGPDYGELFLHKYGHVKMTLAIKKALAYRHQPDKTPSVDQ